MTQDFNDIRNVLMAKTEHFRPKPVDIFDPSLYSSVQSNELGPFVDP